MNRDFVAGAVIVAAGLIGILVVASSGAEDQTVVAADAMPQEGMSQDVMAQSSDSAAVAGDARLYVPDVNYRRDWVQLGTFSVQADDPEEGAGQLHVVYAERDAIEAYLKDGVFPDGATLVKDVFAAKTEDLTTGRASYAGSLAGRFVMVKDSDNSEAGSSPLWGDGWGWAFYEGEETQKTVTTNYVNDCLGCHQPAAATDLLYVRGYPLLARSE